MIFITLFAVAIGSTQALHIPSAGHSHKHSSRGTLSSVGGSWYHAEEHPAHALFRRATDPAPSNTSATTPPASVPAQITTDQKNYPAPGSDAWYSRFPSDQVQTPDVTKLPKAWTDALYAAIASGKIPTDIPVTFKDATGEPNYGANLTGTDPSICSSTVQCRIEGDIWDAPDGVIGIGFDDGPLPSSDVLYSFLKANNQTATHYFIGVNILDNPKEFLTAFHNGDDIAVHTWSHPLMTTKNNLEVVAELGWTIQLIHDSTGGRIPKYWRPPYGDSDKRVHAIAKEVFGLTGIIWNHDTEDWSMDEGGTTPDKIATQFGQWLSGPKTPGLIILEHELTNGTVAAFIKAYPSFATNGWKPISQARLFSTTPYRNTVAGLEGKVKQANVYEPFKKLAAPLTGFTQLSAVNPNATSTTVSSAPVTTAIAPSPYTSSPVATVFSTQFVSPAGASANGSSSSGYTLHVPSRLSLLSALSSILLIKCFTLL